MFIVVEGIDGAGKTTQVALLAERLKQCDPRTIVTQEPGGTPLGDRLRDVVKHGTDLDISERAELLLFATSRAQLVERVLRPALNQGIPVLCDRYIYSTIAYQGYGRGMDRSLIAASIELATNELAPDLVILLDLDVRDAMTRKHEAAGVEAAAGGPGDRFEGEAAAFHQRVRQGYREQAAAAPDRWLVLDASQPAEKLAQTIWERVAPGVGNGIKV